MSQKKFVKMQIFLYLMKAMFREILIKFQLEGRFSKFVNILTYLGLLPSHGWMKFVGNVSSAMKMPAQISSRVHNSGRFCVLDI